MIGYSSVESAGREGDVFMGSACSAVDLSLACAR